MALTNTWKPRIDGVDDADSSAVNEIADAVIELENKSNNVNITIDTEMSDTSENAVQNKVIKAYVDGITGDIEIAIDNIINIQNSYIGGDSE